MISQSGRNANPFVPDDVKRRVHEECRAQQVGRKIFVPIDHPNQTLEACEALKELWVDHKIAIDMLRSKVEQIRSMVAKLHRHKFLDRQFDVLERMLETAGTERDDLFEIVHAHLEQMNRDGEPIGYLVTKDGVFIVDLDEEVD